MKFKKIIAVISLFISGGLALSTTAFAQTANIIEAGQGEVAVIGGISISDTTGNYEDASVKYGGSGYILGLNMLMYPSKYIGLGLDVSYADNGNGDSFKLSDVSSSLATQHITPMFFAKLQPMANLPFRLYIPLGIGFDFMTVSLQQDNVDEKETDTTAGLALMAGLGFEVDVAPDAFIGAEARYIYTDLFSRNKYSIKSADNFVIAFRAGVRFTPDNFWD
ncbi:MAG: outer membrane beta-barrel protein [Elusimicrobiota bacterium]|jgi:opacity protein-like surface antigen|nr:outer membrane beta-barrel protein [Elusimicrobiota bacterium]